MKILVISNTPWNCANSFGATYNALFKKLIEEGKVEIANIYCNRGLPDETSRGRFLQITEKSILKNRLDKSVPMATEVCPSDNATPEGSHGAFYTFMRKTRLQICYWGRDLIWLLAREKSREIECFIESFQPDVVFSPLYPLFHTNRLARNIKELTGKPLILYVYDDVYSLKQHSFSPLFWIDRWLKRKMVRRTVQESLLLYTICSQQMREYARELCVPCKELHKPCLTVLVNNHAAEACTSKKMCFLYAGNIGNGRWKTLSAIGKALQKNNIQDVTFDVYTATPLDFAMKMALKKHGVSVHNAVSPDELEKLQRAASALIYAEPFGGKGACLSRLSLSTKLPDYLMSGKPVFAAGKNGLASIEYLKNNNAAKVVCSKKETDNAVLTFVDELLHIEDINSSIKERINNGQKCAENDFSENKITEMLYNDLKRYADGEYNSRILHINAVFGKEFGSTGALTEDFYRRMSEHSSNYIIAAEKGAFFKFEQKLHALLSRITGYQARYSFFETRKIIKKIDRIKPDKIYLGNLHSNFVNVKKLLKHTAEINTEINIILHDCWFLNGKCNYNIAHQCNGVPCRKKEGACPALKKDIPSWFFDRTQKQFLEKKDLLSRQKHVNFIGVSNAITEEAKKVYGNLSNAEFITKYNWYDEKEFFPEKFQGERDNLRKQIATDLGVDSESTKIISCAASVWNETKGLFRINKLAEKLGNNYIIILAGKTSRNTIVQNAKTNKKLFFVGHLSQGKLRNLFTASDMVISASSAESFGLTMAEAMACGTPVAAVDGFGAEEVAGILFREVFGESMPKTKGDVDVVKTIMEKYESITRNVLADKCVYVAKKYFREL